MIKDSTPAMVEYVLELQYDTTKVTSKRFLNKKNSSDEQRYMGIIAHVLLGKIP
jgi:hypothetical protein